MRHRRRYVFIILLCAIFTASPAFAQETKAKCFSGVEILSGWGQANLKTKQDYHFIPLIVDFDFDLKNLNENLRSAFPGLLQFQIEPFFSLVLQPNHNIELGNTFGIKAGIFPETYKFQPYVRVGAGGIYITQHIPEHSTQLNFCEYAGAGGYYFFTKNTAFTCEFRYRHLSNGDIKKPNKGISSYMTICGLAYKF
jgi:hypothetical protein